MTAAIADKTGAESKGADKSPVAPAYRFKPEGVDLTSPDAILAWAESEKNAIAVSIARVEDREGKLAEVCGIGRRILHVCQFQADHLAAKNPNAKYGNEDVKAVCLDVYNRLSVISPISGGINVVQSYFRIALTVDCLQRSIPDVTEGGRVVKSVEQISYHAVRQFLAASLEYEAETLSIGWKKGWESWTVETAQNLLSSTPKPFKEIRESRDEHQAKLDQAKAAGMTDDAIRKAAERKRTAERNAARKAVTDGIDSALKVIDSADVASTVSAYFKETPDALKAFERMPAPDSITPLQASEFIAALFAMNRSAFDALMRRGIALKAADKVRQAEAARLNETEESCVPELVEAA